MGDDRKKQQRNYDLEDHDDNPGEDAVSYHGVETRGRSVSRESTGACVVWSQRSARGHSKRYYRDPAKGDRKRRIVK